MSVAYRSAEGAPSCGGNGSLHRRRVPRQSARAFLPADVRVAAPLTFSAGGHMLIATLTMAAALAAPQPTSAQAPRPPQTFTLAASLVRGYHGLQQNLLAAAEKMPDADYAFRPTPAIRPFGELIAHVALSQFGACAALKGETNPKHDVKEDAARTKAEQIALLKESAAYCDPAIDGLDDAALTQTFKSGPNTVARGLVVTSTNAHGNEMYGTIAVYLRLKGIVPPTTEREEAARKKGSGQ
jgi:hypothetical protein